MNAAEMEQKVRVVIADLLGIGEDEIKPESTFMEDMGADSLDMVELVMSFEEEFKIEIPDADAEKLKTFQDVIEYLKTRLAV